MTGTHRDTICRLLVEIGEGCAQLMDEQMRDLPCRRIEVDEIWSYQRSSHRGDSRPAIRGADLVGALVVPSPKGHLLELMTRSSAPPRR